MLLTEKRDYVVRLLLLNFLGPQLTVEYVNLQEVFAAQNSRCTRVILALECKSVTTAKAVGGGILEIRTGLLF